MDNSIINEVGLLVSLKKNKHPKVQSGGDLMVITIFQILIPSSKKAPVGFEEM